MILELFHLIRCQSAQQKKQTSILKFCRPMIRTRRTKDKIEYGDKKAFLFHENNLIRQSKILTKYSVQLNSQFRRHFVLMLILKGSQILSHNG